MKNNLCISCSSNYHQLSFGLFVECYSQCPEGYINIGNICQIYTDSQKMLIENKDIIFDMSTDLFSKLTEISSDNYCDNKFYILVENELCIEKCSSIEFLSNSCKAINNSLAIKIDIINSIKEDIINGNLKELLENVTNNIDLEISYTDIIYQFTSTFNQENKAYENVSVVKLLECENRLKTFYNISYDLSLIIFKVDIYQEGLLMPIVEYEVYHPLTFQKLDLDKCSNVSIEIDVPVSINEDQLFKYDPKSDFYNDKCYPFTSEKGTDIILTDRQNEFIEKNLTLCENNCQYIGYNLSNKYASCKCNSKNYINVTDDVIIDNVRLLNSFKDIKYMINLEVMKCYSKLFKKEGIIYNIGCYILFFSIIFFIVSLIIFIRKGFKSLLNQINIIAQNNKIINNKNLKRLHQTEPGKTKKMNKRKKVKNKILKKEICFTERDILTTKKNCFTKSNKKTDFPPKKKMKKSKIIVYKNKSSNNVSKANEMFNTTVKTIQKENKRKIIRNAEDKKVQIKLNSEKAENNDYKNEEININRTISYFTDNEINALNYNEALRFDKRSYCKYYLSLIRTKHMFFFAFFPNNDYNSQIIKISLFLFSFILYYTINGFFFTYNTIHEIYKNSGKFDFIYQLPQILYSTLISTFINALIKYFSLSEKNILQIKNETNINQYKNIIPKLIKLLKIKFIIFYALSFIFLLFFWFYLSCFCAVYRNSQIYLIEDTLISFALSLLYPVGLNLLPGLFRIPSLKADKKDKKCLYDLSKMIQLV